MPTPQQKTRIPTDAKLATSGWIVQTCREMNLAAGSGLALGEFPGAHGPSDYLLYVDADHPDGAIVAEDQIRSVVRAFDDKLFTQPPGRAEVDTNHSVAMISTGFSRRSADWGWKRGKAE